MPSPDQRTRLTIVAIHGNGGGGFRFDRMHPFVAPDVNLVCPTLPGFADTARNPALQTISDYAETLTAIIEQLPPPLVLLGHGIGGSIALDYLQRHESTVQGLILHAPVGALLHKRLFPKLLRLPIMADLGKKIFTSRPLRRYFVRRLFKYQVPCEYLDKFFKEYEQCTVFKEMFLLIDLQWFQSLKPVSLPSAIIWGGQDNVLSSDQLKAFQPLLMNPVVKKFINWGHFPMIDLPEEYSQEITEISRSLVRL